MCLTRGCGGLVKIAVVCRKGRSDVVCSCFVDLNECVHACIHLFVHLSMCAVTSKDWPFISNFHSFGFLLMYIVALHMFMFDCVHRPSEETKAARIGCQWIQ